MVEGKATSDEDITAEVLTEECIPPTPSPTSTPVAPTRHVQTHEPQTPLQSEPDLLTQFSPLPEAPTFLSDLFANDFSEADDLRSQVDRVINNQQSILSLMSKIFGAVQSIGQLLGNKDILNGVEFSTVREQNQGLLGSNQNTRQIANVGESRYGADFNGLTSSMPNGQMSGEELNQSEDTSETSFVDGGSVSADGLDWGEDSAFFREIIKIKGGSCSIGNFAVKLIQKFYSASELVNRNCRGTRGKEPLEPTKLARVRACTFKFFPTPSTLKEGQWKKCVIAIDEYLRRKKKEASDRQD